MSDIDWLKTSRNLLIGLAGKCMWHLFADWSRIGVVSMISAWSLHALLVGKCWGAENNEIDIVLAIAGQLHAKEMSNPSTCYTLNDVDRKRLWRFFTELSQIQIPSKMWQNERKQQWLPLIDVTERYGLEGCTPWVKSRKYVWFWGDQKIHSTFYKGCLWENRFWSCKK